MAKIRIISANEKNRLRWDRYITKSEHGTFYHQWGWREVVKTSLGHRPFYLAAEKESRIKGVLPLFLVKNPLAGRFLVSVPGANYGGICADDPDTSNMLLQKAKALCKKTGAAYLELRNSGEPGFSLPVNDSFATILIHLDQDPDKVWRSFRKSVRNTARKAARAKIKIEFRSSQSDTIPIFHDLYSRNMQQLGSPCFGQFFFTSIIRQFPNDSRIVTARIGNKIVAVDLIVFFKKSILSLYAGTDHNYLKLGVNTLLTWEEIRYGCANGFKRYDFGRSTLGSGSFDFKKRWNGEIHRLCYNYYLHKAKKNPLKNPLAPGYRMASGIWKRLPLPLTRYIGPHIVKYLH